MTDASIDELMSEAGVNPSFNDGPSLEQQQSLTQLGTQLVAVDEQIKAHERQLKKLKEQKTELERYKIPDYMDEIGQDFCGLAESEADIVLQAFVHARIPEDQKQAAFDWLEANGHGDLIRVTVALSFSRGDLGQARALQDLIVKAGHPRPSLDMGVHWKTLESFCKDHCVDEQGKPIYDHDLPEDLLGLTVGRIVKLKRRR